MSNIDNSLLHGSPCYDCTYQATRLLSIPRLTMFDIEVFDAASKFDDNIDSTLDNNDPEDSPDMIVSAVCTLLGCDLVGEVVECSHYKKSTRDFTDLGPLVDDK